MMLSRTASGEEVYLFLSDARREVADPRARDLLWKIECAALYDDDLENPVNRSQVHCPHPLALLAHLHERHVNRHSDKPHKRTPQHIHRPIPPVETQVDEQMASEIPGIYLG